jgi:uncharacterized membrane protein YraQ (UPF0718 family)
MERFMPAPVELPSWLDRLLRLVRVDFEPAHRQPSALRVLVALVISVAGSLAADALLVVAGTAIFPSTKGYVHFQFHDYAKLTIIGVVIACLAWPIVTRISSAPRWLFFRLAILVTLVLWLPDLYILDLGQPGRAVAVLMLMHLAIALVTYNCLVHLAPVRAAEGSHRRAGRPTADPDIAGPDSYAGRRI